MEDLRLKELPVEELIEQAELVRKKAYAPYSQYSVGAALLTRELRIYTGCNVENAAYGSTICAERCAMLKAVSEGSTKWKAIVIIGGRLDEAPSAYAYPCGACRQFMQEFAEPSDFYIIVAKSKTDFQVHTLQELLPCGFGENNIVS